MKECINVAVLASGNGSNFEAIATAEKEGKLSRAHISILISDKEGAYARVRARRLGIKEVFINPKNFRDREGFEKGVLAVLKKENTDLVVLAGFMRILSVCFVKEYRGRILNIHPSLLPSFRGMNAIKRAYDARVNKTGVTVHFVDEEVDHGPIVLQEQVNILGTDTLEDVEEKIHKIEHIIYPKAVRLFAEGKLYLKEDNTVSISPL
jgi:phosphoribosylglycinamide formyltransferase-1